MAERTWWKLYYLHAREYMRTDKINSRLSQKPQVLIYKGFLWFHLSVSMLNCIQFQLCPFTYCQLLPPLYSLLPVARLAVYIVRLEAFNESSNTRT